MNSTLRLTFLVLLTSSLLQIKTFGQTDHASGLLGDNFSLESALEEFKKAKTLEGFEKALNDEDNRVHNLDLNEDDQIDYITVNDHSDGNVHAIVLSAMVTKNESQDIAVIEIEKDGNESAKLQIVGDEDLYGKDMIVEPFDLEEESHGNGPYGESTYSRIVINVWFWPSVRFIYGPTYVVYRSPWRWAYYPRWWSPWTPLGWSVWRPYKVRYVPRYHVTPVRRVSHAHVVYRPHRKVSRTVSVRHKTSIAKAKTHRVSARTNTKAAGVKTKNGKTVVAKKKTTTTKSPGGKTKTTTAKVKAKDGKKTVKGTKQTKVKKTKKGKTKATKKTKRVKKKKSNG